MTNSYYTLEEDHSDTTGYNYTIGVFSTEDKAERAKKYIIDNSYDQEYNENGELTGYDVEKLVVYEWELDVMESSELGRVEDGNDKP